MAQSKTEKLLEDSVHTDGSGLHNEISTLVSGGTFVEGVDGLISGTSILNGSNQPETTGTLMISKGLKPDGTPNNVSLALVSKVYATALPSTDLWIGYTDQKAEITSTREPSWLGLYNKVSADDNRPIFNLIDNMWYNASSNGELVTNGGFDVDTTGWTANTGYTLTGITGEMQVTRNSGNAYGALQTITTIIGKAYKVKIDISSVGSDTYLSLGTASETNDILNELLFIGSNEYIFIATSVSTYLSIGLVSNSTSALVDNISLFVEGAELGTIISTDGVGWVCSANNIPSIAQLTSKQIADEIYANTFMGYNSMEYIHVIDEKLNNVVGGASIATTYIDRTLNKVIKNTIKGASLSDNKILLPDGVYMALGQVPSYTVNGTKAKLHNYTDGIDVEEGIGHNSYEGSGMTFSFIRVEFTVSGTKAFGIKHWCQSGVGSGLGIANNNGDVEKYSALIIKKVG